MAEPGEESRFRRYKGVACLWKDILLILVSVTGIVSIFNLPLYVDLSFYLQQYLAIFFGLVLSLVFLLVPARKKMAMDRLPWYDSLLAILSLIVGFYLAIFYKEIVVEMGLLLPHRVALGMRCSPAHPRSYQATHRMAFPHHCDCLYILCPVCFHFSGRTLWDGHSMAAAGKLPLSRPPGNSRRCC